MLGINTCMTTFDPNTGFRNGSLAQRNPKAYFVILGAIYAAAWFGLSFVGNHHHRSAGLIAADALICIVFGAALSAIHYGLWRWRTRSRGATSN